MDASFFVYTLISIHTSLGTVYRLTPVCHGGNTSSFNNAIFTNLLPR